MTTKRYLLFTAPLIFLLSCQLGNREAVQKSLENQITVIQNSFVSDKRLNIFDAQARFENGVWLISGETTVPEAKAALIRAMDSILAGKKYTVEMASLPHPNLGDSIHALIRVSVANLRKLPRHSAELVDQATMGAPIKLLKADDDWYLVQTPYRYLGWMESVSFVRLSQQELKNWQTGRLLRYDDLYGTIHSQPNPSSLPVADIVMGSVVKLKDRQGKWTHVLLPDGRAGFLPTESLRDYASDSNNRTPKKEDIVVLSRRLTGIPYLWGGNSAKGFDCSGFTQTVFKMNGILLPRDANQQVKEGAEIMPDEKFSNVLPGDLLFFGREDRITHVGISLGGSQFIHASGDVHVNSLSKEDTNYNEYRRNTFKHVKRVLH